LTPGGGRQSQKTLVAGIDHSVPVDRVVILGRGGAGRSTAAARLGQKTGLPVIELDSQFWRPDLTPTPPHE
jgi:Asp/Glu/hydantoin racemase